MPCRYSVTLDQLGLTDDAGISSRAMSELLAGHGESVGKSSVNDHRAGTCLCARDQAGGLGARIHPTSNNVKVLTLDIENTPHIIHAWGLHDVNASLSQIVKPASTIGVGFKWYHQDEAHFISDHEHGHEEMVRRTHALLNEADIVVGFNSTSFDLPHLNREFVMLGLTPPKPYRQVDVLKVARKQFKFASNKLDWLAQQFGLGSKLEHEGHGLWVKCMDGDADAWARMGAYCRQDVVLTEALYDRVRPWIHNHPHLSMFSGEEWGCPNCGNPDVSKDRDGEAHTNTQRYRGYRCNWCGASVRGTTKLNDSTHTRYVRAS